jgi:hypothetical protein
LLFLPYPVAVMHDLVADQLSSDDGDANVALAASDACARVCRTLTRTLGAIGSQALLKRALLQAQTEHPALRAVVVGEGTDVGLEGIAEAAAMHGEPSVVAGLETLLGALLALLGRLIGKDMVARLVAQSASMMMADEEDK